MRVRLGVFAILCGVAACSPGSEPAAHTTTPHLHQRNPTPSPASVTPALSAAPVHYLATSSVAHLAFSTASNLPVTRPAADTDVICDSHSRIAPETPGGKLLQDRGWHIISEEKLGGLDAVAIVRRTIPAARIRCAVEHGRVAIFEGDHLIATLAAGKRSRSIIGWLESLGNGTLRVWPSVPEPPIGDLKLTGRKILLVPTAGPDSICNGKATVPNLFGKPIRQARRLMIAAGWAPVRAIPTPKPRDEGYHHYLRHGIIEIWGCARYEAKECEFRYRSTAGKISVITAKFTSKGRPVVYYNPFCDVRSGKDKYDPYTATREYQHYP